MKQRKNTFRWRVAALCLTAGLLISGVAAAAAREPVRNNVGAVFMEEHDRYLIGYPEGDIRPNSTVSRAEVAVVLFRLLAADVHEVYFTQKNSFSDVAINEWFNNAISTMRNMGVVSGFADSTFRPDERITRGQVAMIFARLAEGIQAQPVSTGVSFTDTQGHWAEDAIVTVTAAGWMRGYEDGSFCPENTITRAEFAVVCNRILERVPENEEALLPNMARWSDVSPEDWYYLDICEATNKHEHIYTDTLVPGTNFYYEKWTKLIPIREWVGPERDWGENTGNEGDGSSAGM